MSRRRKLSIVLGVVLAVVVVVSAIGIGWLYVALRPIGEFFEHGYLGQPEQRQRIELPDHGFTISFADEWIVEEQARDTVEAERSGPRAVLTARLEGDIPRCAVDSVVAQGPTDGVAILRAWAAAHAERFEIGTCDEAECDTSRVDLPEGVVATAFFDTTGSLRAGWYVPLADDAVLLTCVLEEETGRGADADFTTHQGRFAWGMLPIIGSIEALAPASPGPTDVTIAPGQRVETPGGLAVILPEGWTSLPPELDDREEALPLFLQQLWLWRVSLNVAVIGPQPDEGENPVESCMLGEMVLADYMRSWDEASLESIVALVEPIIAPGDTRAPSSSPGSPPISTYPRAVWQGSTSPIAGRIDRCTSCLSTRRFICLSVRARSKGSMCGTRWLRASKSRPCPQADPPGPLREGFSHHRAMACGRLGLAIARAWRYAT